MNNNPCLRSMCIFNPTFSKGKEERAMDNIIFFYPPQAPPNQQMNTVGFATAVSAVLERFSFFDAEEISTDMRNLVLYSPMPDYWLCMETESIFDKSTIKPLLCRAYDTFCLRYGVQNLIDGKTSGAIVVTEFFNAFCRFLTETVLFTATASLSVGTVAAQSPIVASAEAMLNLPLQTCGQNGAAPWMAINSLIADRLSMFACTAAAAEGKRIGGEHTSVLEHLDASVCVFQDGFRVVGSDGFDKETVLQMYLLLLIEPNLIGPITFVIDGTPRNCCVARKGPTTLFLLMEWEKVEALQSFADRLVFTIADYCVNGDKAGQLRSGSSSEPPTPQKGKDRQRATAALQLPGGSAAVPTTPPSATAFANNQATFHVVQYHDSVGQGAMLHTLPRLVHWSLTESMRELIDEEMVASLFPTPGERMLRTPRLGGDSDKKKQWAVGLPPVRTEEMWFPLNDDVWFCVAQRNGRIVGIVFHNANRLTDCYDLGDKVLDKVFFLNTHQPAPQGSPSSHRRSLRLSGSPASTPNNSVNNRK